MGGGADERNDTTLAASGAGAGEPLSVRVRLRISTYSRVEHTALAPPPSTVPRAMIAWR